MKRVRLPWRRWNRVGSSLVIENFIEAMQAERGASNNTADAYRRDLEGLSGFLASKKKDFINADASHLQQWMVSL